MQIIGIILIIIVITLYWFWVSYTRRQSGEPAQVSQQGVQELEILVKGVYSPAVVKVKAGQPVRLKFLRQEDTECSRFVSFPDFKIHRDLPQDQVVPIEFTPNNKGTFTFTCDMGMYQGKLIVE